MPKVSVMIPVYDSGDVLRRTVKSVLAQTMGDFELILLNDGSPDPGTRELVDELGKQDRRIRVFHQANRGVYATNDIGVGMAQGMYVYYCAHDDYLHPQLLELGVRVCEKNDADFVALRWECVDVKTEPRLRMYDDDELNIDVVDHYDIDEFCRLIGKVHTDGWAQFMRRDLSVKFPFMTNGTVLRTVKCVHGAKKWGVIHNPLYFYSVNVSGSLMHKPIHADWVNELHRELIGMYDFAQECMDERQLNAICEKHIVPGLLTVFHMIKHSRRSKVKGSRAGAWRAFAMMAADFLCVRKISPRLIGIKHFVEYFAVTLFFGGFSRKGIGAENFRGHSAEME